MISYPWLKFYPEGVAYEIDPGRYKCLPDMFEECFQKYQDLIAYENIGSSITFNQLDLLSQNFAGYLQGVLGLKKGERIAIQMPNLMQYPVALMGALRAGLIVVNTNPLYTPREMEHQFRDADLSAIVILSNFAHNLEKILSKTSIKHIIITNIGDLLGGLKGIIVNAVVKYVKKMVPGYNLPGALSFSTAIQSKNRKNYKKIEISGEDLAFLQYTGGTTGISKGACLSHRNMISNTEQISEWMKPKLKEREEIVITALPLYHIFALTVNCLAMMKIGARNILITNPRDMKAFIKELKKYSFTVFTGVNTLYNSLMHQQDFKSLDFSRFKIAVGGGMAVQNIVADHWKQLTGTPLVEGYGLSETAPELNCNPIDGTERIGTIGVPVSSTEIKIMDESGKELPLGEPGELCARGPQVMSGYWQKPDDTRDVFFDDWFRTGDIAIMDKDGFFRIIDRKKEMINVSGFNVYPNEIEDVIAAHPKVLEVGVIGVPDDKSGETVKVFVVKKDESLTEDELKDYCRQNLTAYKRPRYIVFRKELPKSNVGKILRRVLKEESVG